MAKLPSHLEVQDAERAVLGGILLDNAALDRVASILEPADFHAPRHRMLYEKMLALSEAREPIDPVTLGIRLEQAGLLEEVGGPGYVIGLAEVVVTSVNLEHHARIVRDRAEVRRLIQACAGIIDKAQSGEYEDTQRLLDEAQQAVYELGQKQQSRFFTPVKEALKLAVENVRRAYESKITVTGTPTGFTDLDDQTAGLQPGDMIVLGARPSMGKTAFALSIATNAARAGTSVAIFSLEMPTTQIVARMLASEARVDFAAMRTGHITEADIAKIIEAVKRMSTWRMFVDDTSSVSVMEARAKCRRLASDPGAGPLGLVVIDYLQLMKGRPDVRSREQEISDISRNLKAMAKELNVPVMALSQLSRGVESRPNKRPVNSDLRESGAIEQDADVIMFIYRDEVYNENSEEKGVAEIIIGKQRNGPIGTVKLKFFKQWTRFDNLKLEE